MEDVLREAMLLVGVGVLLRLPAAFALARLLQKQLFGMSPNDPVSVGSALLGILLIAALSGYIPARRATRIDPLIALRYE